MIKYTTPTISQTRGRKCRIVPTMKPMDAKDKPAPKAEKKLDLSKVKVEPLFEEFVDFDTFSKSDFIAVKIKDCFAVPKSKKLLQFTLNDGSGFDRAILSGVFATLMQHHRVLHSIGNVV